MCHPSLKEIKSICKFEHEYVDWLEHAYELMIRENNLLKGKVELQSDVIDGNSKSLSVHDDRECEVCNDKISFTEYVMNNRKCKICETNARRL
jgi:hypothetical protein